MNTTGSQRGIKSVPRRLVRRALERLVAMSARRVPARVVTPEETKSIFVLRNNDLGDVIIVTPLFDALRRAAPNARIVAGVGAWSAEILEHNPHVAEVLTLTAPWGNKFLLGPPGGALTYLRHQLAAARYVLFSREVAELRARRFDVGIDVLGSVWGSLLLIRAGIPYRLGVRGYEGGHSGASVVVDFDPDLHVGRAALRFAERLGARELPAARPQIFLTASERAAGEAAWSQGEAVAGSRPLRVVVAPGGGLPAKCWPLDGYVELIRLLEAKHRVSVRIVGGKTDIAAGEQIARQSSARSLAGSLSLRETFAILASSDLVICNPSMVMHAAAAFEIPTFVLLTDAFDSATGHDRQWGHRSCRSLGRDEGRPGAYSATEAFAVVDAALAKSRAAITGTGVASAGSA